MELTAGELLVLTPKPAKPEPDPTPVAAVADPLMETPPEPAPTPVNWVVTGQIASALVGVGVGTFGYLQYSDGMAVREGIIERQNDNKLGTADDFRTWVSDNGAATDQVNQGIWITSMGGVLVVATTVWWLLSDAPPSTTSIQVNANQGALVGGSF